MNQLANHILIDYSVCRDNKAAIPGEMYVNGAKVTTFNPYFPTINKVATAMRNNMEGKMTIRNLEICQGKTITKFNRPLSALIWTELT